MRDDIAILHVDMDAFYAAVEQRDNPKLRGRPVIVGGPTRRGVVSAASYEARRFGVHSAMPVAQARRLCADGVFLPVRMGHYAAVSSQIRDILLSFTPLVEPLSLDEAFLDVRGCEKLFGPAPRIARTIKERIHKEIGLIASVGVAPNKFLAKLASDLGKPDSFVVVGAEEVRAFLEPLPVSRIWGVGVKSNERLQALGVRTIGQLAALGEESLREHFGAMGTHFWQLANGMDSRTVVPDREAKSISTETTFSHDISSLEALRVVALEQTENVAARLRHSCLMARTIDLKVRSADFRTTTMAHSLDALTDATDTIWQAVRTLFDRFAWKSFLPVRLLGVGATRLARAGVVQGDLFEEPARQKRRDLDHTVDNIRDSFGRDAIQRGSLLEREEE